MWIRAAGHILNMNHIEYLTLVHFSMKVGDKDVSMIGLSASLHGKSEPLSLNSSQRDAKGIDYINTCLDEIYHAIEQGMDFFDVNTVPYEVQY